MSVHKRHARIEAARQQLVNAEEAYLRAHGWTRLIVAGDWMFTRSVTGAPHSLVIMNRTDAVKFQHDRED